MKKFFRILLWTVIGLVFIGTFVYLYKNSQDEEVRYSTVSPSRATIERTTVLTGKIEPRDEIDIKPQISGIISEIEVEAGDRVQAGDVIGYMGRTGYSTKENVNNIDEYHLHLGLQLIFDESQREGSNEIWIDLYPLTQFLSRHQSEAVRNDETKEWVRKYPFKDPAAEEAQGEKER